MKRKWFKILFYIIAGLAALILFGLSYIKLALPEVGPPPDIMIEGTEEQIDRGDYLANGVMICMQCHSQRDFSRFAAPSKPGTRGIGGEVHGERLGFPGKYVSTNLTPYHLGTWTDGEIFRAITAGVNREGKALFPIMPHPNFGQLDEEDIKSVIAYLRTLSPVSFEPEPSHSNFPMNFIVNLIPRKPEFTSIPDRSDRVALGAYLVTAGSCRSCHTKQDDKGGFIGPEFGGGMEFTLIDGSVVRSANITPHPTGIGNWSKEDFIQRFRKFTDEEKSGHKVDPGDFQTVMPWNSYAKMTTEDLGAIYSYLRELTPAEHTVEIFTRSPK